MRSAPVSNPGRLFFLKRVGDTVFLQLAIKGGFADAQQLGGLQFVAVQGANGPQDRLTLKISQGGQLEGGAFDGRFARQNGRTLGFQALLLPCSRLSRSRKCAARSGMSSRRSRSGGRRRFTTLSR